MAPAEVNSWIVRVRVLHALIDQKDEVEILRSLPQGSRQSLRLNTSTGLEPSPTSMTWYLLKSPRKNGENGSLWWVSSVATLQVRPIDKLDKACTNADDQMMLVRHHSSDFESKQRRATQIFLVQTVRVDGKWQPAQCSRKTQDQFAIASMAKSRKLLHRFKSAQESLLYGGDKRVHGVLAGVCRVIREPRWEGVRVLLSWKNLERRTSMRPSKSFVRVLRGKCLWKTQVSVSLCRLFCRWVAWGQTPKPLDRVFTSHIMSM